MNDLVSVIIPTYNRSHFVTAAIDSVLSQTYPNIEIIVVNDGSTDDTEERLQPYMDSITYISKENGGLSSAVNAGLRVANGKYIARLDDDDCFMPDKTEKQLRVFAENPGIGLVTCGFFFADETGRHTSVKEVSDFATYGPFLSVLLRELTMLPSLVMMLRDVHDQVGLYRDVFAEDLDMYLRATRYWDVGAVRQPLVKRRLHSSNITATTSEDKKTGDVVKFIREILGDIELSELLPDVDFMSDPYRESCAYSAKGALYLRYGIFDSAETNLLKALELCPDNVITLLWLGISARSQKDFQRARDYFGEVLKSGKLHLIARKARDLVTGIQRNTSGPSPLLKQEISNEYKELFRITFNGILGEIPEAHTVQLPASSRLKLSQYSVTIDDYPFDGKQLLFNTLTHGMIVIGDEHKELIHSPDRLAEVETSEDIGILKRLGILVNQNVDETERCRQWYNMARNDMSRMRVTVLTTYDCNLACKYCIEEGVKRSIYMDDQVADALVEWLAGRLERNNTERISISFYGGEPLLNKRPIRRISEKLHRFSLDSGVIVSSSITSNGTLLDREMLEEVVEYGLTSIKMTIDGVKEVHDARRPFKDGRGSFGVIIDNIKKIPDSVKLILQSNLDSENMASFPSLLDFLGSSGLKDRIDNLVISPVYHSFDSITKTAARERDCMELSDPELDDNLNYMRKLAAKRGFELPTNAIKYRACSMNRGGAIVLIDPTGAIYSCPAFVGREGFAVGSIYLEELERSKEISNDQLGNCFQCQYFPICGGGCPYKAYTLYGDHTRISCDKEAVDSHTKELIKVRYAAQKIKDKGGS